MIDPQKYAYMLHCYTCYNVTKYASEGIIDGVLSKHLLVWCKISRSFGLFPQFLDLFKHGFQAFLVLFHLRKTPWDANAHHEYSKNYNFRIPRIFAGNEDSPYNQYNNWKNQNFVGQWVVLLMFNDIFHGLSHVQVRQILDVKCIIASSIQEILQDTDK